MLTVRRKFHQPNIITGYRYSMTESITVTSARTEDLNAATRASIIQLCIAAHQEDDFKNLFTYVPSRGWHFLAYRDEQLVSHALVTPPAGYNPKVSLC